MQEEEDEDDEELQVSGVGSPEGSEERRGRREKADGGGKVQCVSLILTETGYSEGIFAA